MAKIQPHGIVELPTELRTFFQQDTTCEVSQYADHLALWRRWRRRADSQEKQEAKVARQGVFRQAWQEYRGLVEHLRPTHPSAAMYLSGYTIECRLKEIVCVSRGTDTLTEAEKHINQQAGTRYRLLGADGHRLELLWRLAGLRIDADSELALACSRQFRWSVAWRYQVTAAARAEMADYWSAYRRIVEYLAKERL